MSSKGHIEIDIDLDQARHPVAIAWKTDDSRGKEQGETKAMHLSLWDEDEQQALRLDLWTDKMDIDEMKRFYINILASMSQGILTATGDTHMAERLRKTCEELAAYHKAALEKPEQQGEQEQQRGQEQQEKK